MDIRTNSFCASGFHLPNGSYVTFGGNDAVTTGGVAGSQKNPDGATGAWDSLFQDFDGRRSIRILNPCKISDNLVSGNCAWFDQPDQLSMKKQRWYSGAEATAEGRIVIIGGMVTGGYINRFVPNVDPATERGAAEPTYEYFPAMDGDPKVLDFVVKTSGLNTYPHTFLMPSGRMLLQANLSTGRLFVTLFILELTTITTIALWDHVNNQEFPLPDMPNGVIRVYPASGATAMLPLTPANNWTPTILFCGGSAMADADWGSYGGPRTGFETWNFPASKDCQRLTPEPLDGSQPHYEPDDDMLEPRTLSQFIILPNGKLLLINGGLNGTGGYLGTGTPYGMSLAAGPVLTPVIYDPNAPKGSRWSNQGLSPSNIPRLYHSTAMLLPDGSVMVAGSNPNADVNLTAFFPTEYRSDIFYPPYFSAAVRPKPQNLPQTLSYGGPYFDILIGNDSFTGDANNAADATVVNLVRGGFTTHAMNMGQRFMQLNNTYTVNQNGSITLHVSQPPPNPNILQPGPALLFVCINGIPSTGKFVIVGNGIIGSQPTAAVSQLPPNSHSSGSAPGPGTTDGPVTTGQKDSKRTPLIAGIVSAAFVLVSIGVVIGIFLIRRRRRPAVALPEKPPFVFQDSTPTDVAPPYPGGRQSDAFSLLHNRGFSGDSNDAMDIPTNLLPPQLPYRDDTGSRPPSAFDPYLGYNDVVQPADSMTNVHVGFSVGTGSGTESPISGPPRGSYIELPSTPLRQTARQTPSPHPPSREGSPQPVPNGPPRGSYVELPTTPLQQTVRQTPSPRPPSREGSLQPVLNGPPRGSYVELPSTLLRQTPSPHPPSREGTPQPVPSVHE